MLPCERCICSLRDFRKECSPEFNRIAFFLEYEKGQLIIKEGAPIYSLHFLCQGKAKMLRTSCLGKRQLVAILGPGEILGPAALSARKEHEYPYDAVSAERCLVVSIRKSDLNSLFRHRPTAQNILEELAEIVSFLAYHRIEVAYGGVQAALAKSLLELGRKFGKHRAAGKVVEVDLTKVDLADMVGITREAASRHLLRMETDGLLAFEKRKAVLLDEHRLELLSAAIGS
ncbi:MAG TPA: Crp/Fnr family transcriptional regulator [bacterium]|nr:Crp/Fnr family transcriptional regulator [bacterium]